MLRFSAQNVFMLNFYLSTTSYYSSRLNLCIHVYNQLDLVTSYLCIYLFIVFDIKHFFYVKLWSAQELERDIHGPAGDSLPAEKRLVVFDKIFAAYHEARSSIRSDLVRKIHVLYCSLSNALLSLKLLILHNLYMVPLIMQNIVLFSA